MRPLHVLLLVVAIAAVLLGALFFIRSDDAPTRTVAPLPADPAASTAAHGGSSALSAPDKDGAAPEVRTAATAGHFDPGPAPGDAKTSSAVHGRVVDASGHPVAGATVYASAAGGFPGMAIDEYDPRDMPFFSRVDAKTDAQGRFAVEPKAQGSVRLAVRASGFAPLDVEKPIASASADVGDLELEPGAILLGRVVDSSGRGVEGAEIHRQKPAQSGGVFVMSFNGMGGGPVIAKTDERGDFRVDQLAVGPWSLLVTSESHPDKSESGETDRTGQAAATVQITLDDGFDIQGRVTGATGDALKNLVVQATPGRNSEAGEIADIASFSPGQTRRAKVAADGTFTVRGAKKGATYRLSARSGERRAMMMGGARSASVEAKAGDRGVEIVYRPETALVFQVVDAATGAPVTEMSVQAGFRFPFPLLDEKHKPVKSFPDGRVRFASLPQGGEGENATLIVEAQGYTTFERKDLKVVFGQDNDLGVIRLEHSALVHVTVLEASTGAPIVGAQVSLNEVTPQGGVRGMRFSIGGQDDEDSDIPQGSAHRGKTDAQGKAAISSLAGKRATINVKHKDHAVYKSETLDLPLTGDFDHVVKLLSGGTVVVHVIGSGRTPVAGEGVDHKAAEGDVQPMMFGGPRDDTTDAEGKLVFAHLAAGKHLFRVSKAGGGGGIAFGGGRVMIAKRMSGSIGGSDDEEESGWTAVVVEEGSTQDLELVAPQQGSLTGRVTESGKLLSGATVALKSKDSDEIELPFLDDGVKGETNAKGEYTIEKVPAGDYRVVVTHPSRAMRWEGEAHVQDGTNRKNFELPLAIVEGRVTGQDGKPIAGVRVHAERSAAEDAPQRQMVVSMVVDSGDGPNAFLGGAGSGGTVVTDADGRYRLRGVASDVELTVIASGKDLQRESSPAFKVAPDQVKSGVDLKLKQGATIEVLVRHAGAGNVPTCAVHAELDGAEDADVKTEITNAEGKTRFTGLKPGRWKLSCNRLGDDPTGATPIPDQLLDVQVGPAKSVTFDLP